LCRPRWRPPRSWWTCTTLGNTARRSSSELH
jgi:hypothetical protein